MPSAFVPKPVLDAMNEAEAKAIKALAGYKFIMFGYHAAVWVSLNRLAGVKRPNPFKKLVELARKEKP